MRVQHVSTKDISGGAARAAYRLHVGLQRAGRNSSMFVLHRTIKHSSVTAFEPPRDFRSRLARWLRRKAIRYCFARYRETRPSGLEPFTDARTQYGRQVIGQLPECDIINLHWIRRFIDLESFFGSVSTPVVWTLHDMNALTGGCHYNKGCEKYVDKCGTCPQLGSTNEKDLSRKVWRRKKQAYDCISPERLHIVTPCQWMKQEAARSSLLHQYPVTVIPYGVDTVQFAPRDGQATRRALGIPQEANVLLFVAQSTTNRRKGFALLAEVLETLQKDQTDIFLLSVGASHPAMEQGANELHLGRVENDRLLSAVYSAADVFVIPSLQDNLPNTVLESMACGTPVVGFDTGGISDMVRPDETGWLAEVGNVHALREAIEQALSDDAARERMGRRCRAVVEEEYTLEIQAARYHRLYETLLEQCSAN